MPRSWKTYSVTGIALALFRQHDWDFDRAIAAAFWLKNGCLIDKSPWRHWAKTQRIKHLPDITDEQQRWLLYEYNTRGLNRPG